VGQPRTESFWMPLHERLVEEADQGQGDEDNGRRRPYDIILYGDSITESWRGTQAGHHVQWADGNADVFRQMQSTFHIGAFGISGDQTHHLLWRLRNGEISRKHPPRLAVVLIGTNNLGVARRHVNGKSLSAEEVAESLMEAVPAIISDIESIIERFHEVAPLTHVLLVGILPRASHIDGKPRFELPGTFSNAIASANAEMKRLSLEDDLVHYVDCGEYFVDATGDGIKLSQTKMPDGLHPGGKGAASLVACLEPAMSLLLDIKS
jgi:lysophospholipase L1-like esterase